MLYIPTLRLDWLIKKTIMLSQLTRLQAKTKIHTWWLVKFYKIKYVIKLMMGLIVFVMFLISLTDLDIQMDFMHGGRHIQMRWIYRFQMIFQMNGIKWIRGINPPIKKNIILIGTINIGVIKSQTKIIEKKKRKVFSKKSSTKTTNISVYLNRRKINDLNLLTFHTTKNKREKDYSYPY